MSGSYTKIFRALGTVCSLTLPYDQPQALPAAAVRGAGDAVAAYVAQLHALFNIFDPASSASRLNAAAGRASVDFPRPAADLLSQAVRASTDLDGDFAVTVRPLTALWRQAARTRRLPSDAQIQAARALVNDDDLVIDGTHVGLVRPGQGIDPGSFVKGAALDGARDILKAAGVTRAVLNFGGSVALMGQTGRVGIRHPDGGPADRLANLTVTDQCLVTSGDYERYFTHDGRRLCHIIDPPTGRPAQTDLRSVTVIGPSAGLADRVTTAMFLRGAAGAADLAARYGLDAVFVDRQLNIYCTRGLEGMFALAPAAS